MSEIEPSNNEQASPSRNSTRLYVLVAAILLVVIVVAVVLLITKGLPPWDGQDATAVSGGEVTATSVPTFTPGPTSLPTNTPLPSPTPTLEAPVMLDPEEPLFGFESAGARPSAEWTGFFGQVLDKTGSPVAGVSVIVWYDDGMPASSVVRTDAEGAYEIRLAEAPFAGKWNIQLLTDSYAPASKIFSFKTDEDTEKGIQQIQVIWRQVP